MTIEPEMIVLPATEYVMGSDRGQINERPAHRVHLSSFAIGRYTITNGLYQSFLNQTACACPPAWNEPQFTHPEQPVTTVSWFEATEYCRWLGAVTGKVYRLPTEAEWELAARGGLEHAHYTWGNEPPESQPGYNELWASGPEPVGRRPRNGFGLCDISENVHEWCSDWYDPAYYQDSPYDDPKGPESGTRRSSRGGSWRHKIKIARVSARSSIPPDYKYSDYGFRVAMSI